MVISVKFTLWSLFSPGKRVRYPLERRYISTVNPVLNGDRV